LLAALLTMLLAIFAGVIWSRRSLGEDNNHIASLNLLRSAYDKVELGKTSQIELVMRGFDATRLKIRNLSGLGVREYFMPRTSAGFDRLDPAVRACFAVPDRCSAIIIPLAAASSHGFTGDAAGRTQQGHIVFLLKSGRVAYKAINV
jgi:hypothetical protein